TINAIVRHLGVEARFHLAEPSQLRRISREIRVNRRGKFFALNKTFSLVFVVETYPLCRGVSFWHSATENVSAQQYADQGREGTPLLHGGGKPASAIGESSAAAGVVLGRNQRQPTSGMAQNAGGVRREAAAIHSAESVSGGPAGSRRRHRQRAGEAQRDEAGASAAVWQLLAGMRAMAAVATGSVLVGEAAARTGRRSLAAGAGAAGGESIDRSGQRVSSAPAVVRSQRHGRFAGAGFCGCGERSAVPVSGSGAGA